jgi:hypothetical protein
MFQRFRRLGMTNGQKILEVFPRSTTEAEGIVIKFIIDGYSYGFSKCWWDAEYEEPEVVEE